ncbi:unnamed protein product [Heligmosomoides polygyrus]|uniref:Uncharacterized protein n=1 Tax=Heligmosomoides polygyrus TaxID=6339 RepID=A0A3P7Z794_HELPZ|nr:unnamed protein product [Heligmosomoides polygyrus]
MESADFIHLNLLLRFRFNELSWSPSISETHPSGIIFGGTENGTVVFLDAHQLVHNSSLSVISSRRDHQGHVLSVDFSSDARWAISAGAAAQLLLWDLSNLATPFSPGAPNFTDQVRRVRWNRSMANIVASLSSQRGSLWDMIPSGCDWADLCWKPDDSSTLIVASQLALAPGVQKWDLRYPTAPVNEYHVHDRGVTAIDWWVVILRFISSFWDLKSSLHPQTSDQGPVHLLRDGRDRSDRPDKSYVSIFGSGYLAKIDTYDLHGRAIAPVEKHEQVAFKIVLKSSSF